MNIIPGNYRITSILSLNNGDRKLHACASGSPANGQNVILKSPVTGSADQIWYFDGSRLKVSSNTQYCLDRYAASTYLNNADLWKASTNEDANQRIVVESTSDNYCKIRLETKVNNVYYYLTAKSNADGTSSGKTTASAGNVYWAASTGGNNQKWGFTQVTSGGGSSDSDEEITVTYMPSGIYDGNTEYFHPQSGMTNNTWANNGGSSIRSKIRQFYYKVYGEYPADESHYLYNLYGAKLYGTETYHLGVDMYHGGNIISAHSGTVIKADIDGDHYGEVAIYDGTYTYYYLHMANIQVSVGAQVVAGTTVLGTQSNVGVAGSHLHIEIYSGRVANGPFDYVTLTQDMPTVVPYNLL